MNVDSTLFWLQEALKTTFFLGAPMLGVALLIGIAVSLFQAVTSIQEMTLSFVTKVMGVTVVLLILAPWMLQMLIDFTTHVFEYIPNISR